MNPLARKREQILQQMETIDRMAYGSLQRETRPAKRGPCQECGPYYKHQVCEDGQNLTRRIPTQEADALAEAIPGRKRFEKLAEEYIDTTVAMTKINVSPDSKRNATQSKPPSRRKPPDMSKSS